VSDVMFKLRNAYIITSNVCLVGNVGHRAEKKMDTKFWR
jgi:hypothetical protein